MWEVFVPMTNNNGEKFTVEYHREWDKKVRDISGGLTILKLVAKGQWVNEEGDLEHDKIIPVRVACTPMEFAQILEITCEHYSQDMVMGFKYGEVVTYRKQVKFSLLTDEDISKGPK